MSLDIVAAQMSEQLLTVSNQSTTVNMQYFGAVARQQTEDLVTNPSDAPELLGHIGTAAAALRGAQPPIQPPVG